jgi:DtxR family Mn-dependent transcriptional regulator
VPLDANEGSVPAEVSPVVQDYLKRICAAGEWDDAPITTSRLAGMVGVSASTCSEMIRKLAALKFVTHRPYGAVELTDAGRTVALRVMRRHRLVETFLVAELGYRWDEVHDEAEVLEHAISDLMLERIDSKLGHPARDPHGDPIPRADGTLVKPDAVRLSLLDSGETGLVARISDADPEMLRYFEQLSITLDTALGIVERHPFGAGTTIQVGESDGRKVSLGQQALDAIWVSRS